MIADICTMSCDELIDRVLSLEDITISYDKNNVVTSLEFAMPEA